MSNSLSKQLILDPVQVGNKWLFSDGKVLPVISGGDGPLELNTQIPGLNSDNENPPVESGGSLSEFAQGILNQIPEGDRGIVQKYLNTWDSNVTKQFQKIHDEYKPYKELGDVETIQEALQYIGLLNEDPVQFINFVQEALKESGIAMDPEQESSTNLPEWEGVPEPFIQKFSQMEQMINQLNEGFNQFQQGYTEKEQIAQVDNLFKQMHTTHGEFDEDYVLMKMSTGMSPDDAIKSWNETVQKYSSQQRKPPPNLVPGAGGVPSGQVDFSNMTKQQKMAAAVQALQNANANS